MFIDSGLGIPRGGVAFSMIFVVSGKGIPVGGVACFQMNFIVSGIGVPRGWGSIFNDFRCFWYRNS